MSFMDDMSCPGIDDMSCAGGAGTMAAAAEAAGAAGTDAAWAWTAEGMNARPSATKVPRIDANSFMRTPGQGELSPVEAASARRQGERMARPRARRSDEANQPPQRRIERS